MYEGRQSSIHLYTEYIDYILWRLRHEDLMSPGVQGQLGQYNKTLSPLKKKNTVKIKTKCLQNGDFYILIEF